MRKLDLGQETERAAGTEPRRGEAWEILQSMIAAERARPTGTVPEELHVAYDRGFPRVVLQYLGYIAARLDELERRLEPQEGRPSLRSVLDDNSGRTALRAVTPEAALLHMIAARLDRIEGRASPGAENAKPTMTCVMAGCINGSVPEGSDVCDECGHDYKRDLP